MVCKRTGASDQLRSGLVCSIPEVGTFTHKKTFQKRPGKSAKISRTVREDMRTKKFKYDPQARTFTTLKVPARQRRTNPTYSVNVARGVQPRRFYPSFIRDTDALDIGTPSSREIGHSSNGNCLATTNESSRYSSSWAQSFRRHSSTRPRDNPTSNCMDSPRTLTPRPPQLPLYANPHELHSSATVLETDVRPSSTLQGLYCDLEIEYEAGQLASPGYVLGLYSPKSPTFEEP